MHHKKFSIILLLLLIKTQLNNGFTFYEWMERNSYICQDNNSLEPSFLSDEDAIQFNCESLCGNPLLTNQACSRSPSEPNSSPSCTLIPELCLMNFNQEFNDEKTFHLFLNPSPMDKDLFKTTRTFSFPDLMNQEPLDQDIQIVPIEPNEPIVEQTTADLFQTTTTTLMTTTTEQTTTTVPTTTTTTEPTTTTTTTFKPTTTTSTTQSTTTATTTTTVPITTTQISTTQSSTTKSTPKTTTFLKTTTPQTTQKPSTTTDFPTRSKTLIGFRVPLNVFNNAITLQTSTIQSTTIRPLIVTSIKPDKIVKDFFVNSFDEQLSLNDNKSCMDSHISCSYWTALNECNINPKYMNDVCKRSCNQCDVRK